MPNDVPSKSVAIRPEEPRDVAAIFRVNAAAFPTDMEAKLVDRLRAAGLATISLVAEVAGEIVGHVLFSPVTVAEQADLNGAPFLGLAPVAVLPQWQKRGIGGMLIRAGLAACRDRNAAIVVVLGEPEYYGRFGFVPAYLLGLEDEYNGGNAFRVVELQPGTLGRVTGLVRYSPPFAELGS